MEVQREELALLVRALGHASLDHLGDPAVQVAPALERKAFVGGVANQGVAETEAARGVGVAFHELAEPIPCLRLGGDVLVPLEHVDDQLTGERRPQHRRPAQQCAIGRVETVDPRRHERLDGLGQLLDCRRHLLRQAQLLQEEGIPPAALGDGCELLLAQPPIAGRRLRKSPRVVVGERLQSQR